MILKTMFIEIATVQMIKIITPTTDSGTMFYLGKFFVEKILNTNLLKITVLEDSQIGVKGKKLEKNTVFFIQENHIIEMCV